MSTGHDANLFLSGDFATGSTLTAEEFLNYPAEGRRLELVAGEVKEMSPAGFDHGEVMIQLGALLKAAAKKHRAGRVCGGDVGFVLARNPDTVLAPDIAFVRAGRIPASGWPRFVDGAPEIAVEIVSPSDRPAEIEAKARHWIGCGTKLVWVVDAMRQTIAVYHAGGERHSITIEGTLDGGEVLPEFSATLRDIFEC